MDPFRMTSWAITLQSRYRRREGAPDANPPVPDFVEVSNLPSGEGKVEFFDVAHPSSSYRLTKGDFREIYDPAG